MISSAREGRDEEHKTRKSSGGAPPPQAHRPPLKKAAAAAPDCSPGYNLRTAPKGVKGRRGKGEGVKGSGMGQGSYFFIETRSRPGYRRDLCLADRPPTGRLSSMSRTTSKNSQHCAMPSTAAAPSATTTDYTVRDLSLESSLRPRGRPKKATVEQEGAY
jgi:hypothetical protein